MINVDGYNETALALLENVRCGTAVSYPRSWHAKTIVIADPTQSANAMRLLTIRVNRETAARKILDSPLRHSSLFNLLWVVGDKRRHRELIQLGVDVLDSRNKRFRHHGAANSFNDETAARQLTFGNVLHFSLVRAVTLQNVFMFMCCSPINTLSVQMCLR